MHEWITLTTRYGHCIRNPSRRQLQAALDELFASQDPEHPDCWLECGSEGQPLHALSFFSSGTGSYTTYSDSDMSEELQSKEVAAKTSAVALLLWEHLINERYEKL
jgi:hypothetical protein